MKLNLSQILCLVLVACVITGVIYATLEKRSYDNQIATLSNSLATESQSKEIAQGLYEKATITSKNLQDLLNNEDAQNISLKKQLDQKNEDLITATNLMIKWKTDYLAIVAGTQTVLPANPATPNAPERVKVAFSKDFGPILASGFCLTNPPEASVDLHQQRPLKLTLAVSQDAQGLWHTYTSSNEDNMEADIALSAVNPYLTSPKWYERISVSAAVAGGGSGVMAGIGLGVDIGQFTPSIMIFDHSSNLTSPLYGLNLAWRPFKK